jgi:hypothetical protein
MLLTTGTFDLYWQGNRELGCLVYKLQISHTTAALNILPKSVLVRQIVGFWVVRRAKYAV